MKTATKQALSQLKKLVKEATNNVYARIRHADTVMQDTQWIEEVHDGSDLKAQDALQSEFFPDLNGYITLGKLRAMYHNVSEEEWKKNRFDIAAVEIVYESQAESGPKDPRERTSWKKEAEKLADEVERYKLAHKQSSELARKLQEEVEQLRAEVERLVLENSKLLGRLEQMEQFAHAT